MTEDPFQTDVAFDVARRMQRKRARRRVRSNDGDQGGGMHGGMHLQPAPVSPSQHAGSRAENEALAMLSREGLQLIARNLRCRAGEIDLIMQDGDTLVFVEVRARGSADVGGAVGSISRAKRKRLIQTARYFLHTAWRGPLPPCRFDVVAFEAGVCLWLRNAIETG